MKKINSLPFYIIGICFYALAILKMAISNYVMGIAYLGVGTIFLFLARTNQSGKDDDEKDKSNS